MKPAEARDKVLECALEIAKTELGTSPRLRVVLFGSRASGEFDSRSDFDIGFDAGAALSAAALVRIREAFDALDIFQRVDIVDLAVARPEFVRMAAKHEEVILDRKSHAAAG